MAQFARPDADSNNPGSYADNGGGSSNLFSAIDEASPNDADFVRSPQDPSSAVIVFRLSDVTDPVSSSGHTIRARMGTDQSSGGNAINATVELRQGYVNEGSPGTLIATLTQNNISQGSFTTYTYTLSSGEADAITDYSALFLRLVMTVAA